VPDRSALHTLVFESLEDQIAVIDRAGTIVDVNPAWTRFGVENGLASGYASVGRNYLEVLSAAGAGDDASAREAARGMLEVIGGRRDSFYFEYPCHSPDRKRWFMMRVTRLKEDARALFVVSHQDITRRKLAEEQAEHLAMHDPLTGLANRRHFALFLNTEMRRAARNQAPISLIEADIDHFKDYNDALGHLAGDRCLASVGRTLQAFSRRPGDLAARLGGDEFALLLGDTDVAESRRIAAALVKAVDGLELVFRGSRRVTVSVGIASMVPQERQNESELLERADEALYRAKRAGRNQAVHAQAEA
jgi:diguanylate cyclase (GGDEF)-like protein/PAS domain S-box-containing protein